MLIERQVENVIKAELEKEIEDFEIVSSWSPSDSGTVKGERDAEANGVISIFVQPRAHDSFSLPTVNLNGVVAIEARVEKCPTMKEVSEVYEKVLDRFDAWHYDASGFSETFSTSDFYATELMLTGGSQITFDQSQRCWVLSLGFTIRGTVIHG